MTLTTPSIERPRWLDEDVYPFVVRRLDLPSGPVAYVDEGDGPTVLFVHAGMWSFIFRDVIARLRDGFRCVTVDFSGYGVAPAADAELDLPAMSGLLGEFVDDLGLDDVTMVLHDLGGPVGMGWAANEPSRVRALVMANTFAWRPEGMALRGMLRLMSSWPVTALGMVTNLIPRLTATRFGVGRHLDRDAKRAFRGPFRDWASRRRFHRLMRSALRSDAHYDAIERAAATTLADRPVLTIFGERNDPFGFQERHHATFADHQGLVLEKGNHFPMCDDPDLFAATVREWWQAKVQ